VETADKLPSFCGAFEKRRCVVADEFYEWRGPKARCEPLWIHPADGALLLFAGLFEAYHHQANLRPALWAGFLLFWVGRSPQKWLTGYRIETSTR